MTSYRDALWVCARVGPEGHTTPLTAAAQTWAEQVVLTYDQTLCQPWGGPRPPSFHERVVVENRALLTCPDDNGWLYVCRVPLEAEILEFFSSDPRWWRMGVMIPGPSLRGESPSTTQDKLAEWMAILAMRDNYADASNSSRSQLGQLGVTFNTTVGDPSGELSNEVRQRVSECPTPDAFMVALKRHYSELMDRELADPTNTAIAIPNPAIYQVPHFWRRYSAPDFTGIIESDAIETRDQTKWQWWRFMDLLADVAIGDAVVRGIDRERELRRR